MRPIRSRRRGFERKLSIRGSAFNGNLFNALLSLGKEVEFLEYENEDHVLQQPVNVIDFWNAALPSWIVILELPKERRWPQSHEN